MNRSQTPLLVAMGIYVLHAAVRSPLAFVDATISAAYADNLAAGLGFSPYPGAPWVEGFSSPLWVLLLTPLSALGLPTLLVAQVLGGLLGLAGVALAWGLARRLGATPRAAAVAPLLLAASPVWAGWSVAGTEEALIGTLVLASITRLSVEHDDPGRRNLSGLLLAALALSRLDGAILATALALGAGWRRLPARLLLIAAPLAAWEATRMLGFDGSHPPIFSGRTARGWRYVWDAMSSGRLILPTLALAGATMRLPRGRRLQRLLLGSVVLSVGMTVARGGDWAGAHRYLSVALLASAPLIAAAVSQVATRSRLAGLALAALVLAPEVLHNTEPADASAFMTRLRVEHIRSHAASIGLTEISVADPDPGPYLLYTDWPVIDFRGQTDAALRPDASAEEYAERVLGERPAYVHLHGGWARRTKLLRHPDWDALYVEISPYTLPSGSAHEGTYVRRDLLPTSAR